MQRKLKKIYLIMLCLAIKGEMKLMSASVMWTSYPWAAEIALSCARFISPRFLPLPSPLMPIFRKVESICLPPFTGLADCWEGVLSRIFIWSSSGPLTGTKLWPPWWIYNRKTADSPLLAVVCFQNENDCDHGVLWGAQYSCMSIRMFLFIV